VVRLRKSVPGLVAYAPKPGISSHRLLATADQAGFPLIAFWFGKARNAKAANGAFPANP
jgi:hypothetical protein